MKACLILGNGPSLNNLPDDVFKSMPSFGCNYIDRQPTYYICIDTRVLLEHWQEILPRAAGAQIAYLSALHKGSSPLYDLPNVLLVAKDEQVFNQEKYMSGLTASYVALKLAYYAGFDVVHLWGVDHSKDWAHYRADYPAASDTSTVRLMQMEYHYAIAAGIYAIAGKQIINHSNPSRLDMIFRRAHG